MLDLDLHLPLGANTLAVRLASPGPVLGLLGASGVGKSTLLRVIAGLDRRAVGTVSALGEGWQGPGVFRPPWERGIGWAPQDAVLFPHLSVLDNLSFVSTRDVHEIAALLRIERLLGRMPRLLSGGERQRVAVGRALACAPRLLLLDEPFAALDHALRAQVRADLAAWCGKRALPAVIVSHDEADLDAFNAQVWVVEADGVRQR